MSQGRPKHDQKLATQASTALREGRLEEAAGHAFRLLATRPGNRRALRILSRAKGGPEIIERWREAARASPDDPEPWLQIARLASAALDHAVALNAAGEVLTRQPRHIEASKLKWMSSLELRDWQVAAENWHALRSFDAVWAFELIHQLDWQKHVDVVPAMLSGDDSAEHRTRLRGMLQDHIRMWTAAAYQSEITGDLPGAVQNFDSLSRALPGHPDFKDGLRRAVAGIRRIVEAGTRGTLDNHVVECARILISREPDCSNGYLVLARAEGEAERWPEAIKLLEQARTSESVRSLDLSLLYSEALYRCNRLRDAVQTWALAAGTTSEEQRGLPCHAAAFGKVLRDDVAARYARLSEVIDWDEILTIHDCAADLGIADERDTARLMRNISAAIKRAHENHLPELAALCRSYLSRKPDDARVLRILGRCLMRDLRYEDAAPVWEQLYRLAPNLEASLQIARCARRLERAEIGRTHIERVLARDPDHAEARRLLRYFERIPRSAN